jgi:hypothetical protein
MSFREIMVYLDLHDLDAVQRTTEFAVQLSSLVTHPMDYHDR